MRTRVYLFMAAGLCALTLARAQTQDGDLRFGNWVETKAGPSYQGLRRSFEDLGNGLVRINIAVNASGVATSSSEVRCNGQPYPVLDADHRPTDTTLSCRTRNAHVTEFAFVRKGGDWVKSAGTEEVSDDGEKMTVSAVQTDTQGRVVNRVERVFVRKH